MVRELLSIGSHGGAGGRPRRGRTRRAIPGGRVFALIHGDEGAKQRAVARARELGVHHRHRRSSARRGAGVVSGRVDGGFQRIRHAERHRAVQLVEI